MKTYHFCAMTAPTIGSQTYSSGCVRGDGDLMTHEYRTLLQHIGQRMNPPRSADEVVLLSLSIIADDNPPSPPAPPPVDLMRFGGQ